MQDRRARPRTIHVFVVCWPVLLVVAHHTALGEIPSFTPLPTAPPGGPTVAVDRFVPPAADESAWLGVALTDDVWGRLARLRAFMLKSAWEARGVLAPQGRPNAPVDADVAEAALALLGADLLVQGRCAVEEETLTVTTWVFRPGVGEPEVGEVRGEAAKPFEVAAEVALYIAKASGVVLRDADTQALAVHDSENLEALKWYGLGAESAWLKRTPGAPENAAAKARAAFERAVELDPEFAAPYSHLASSGLGTDRAEEGGPAALKALSLPPYSPTTIAYQGHIFGEIWARDEALKEEALRLYSQLPDDELLRGPITFGKAGLLEAIGDVDGALQAYAEAAKYEPTWTMPWLRAGMLAQRNKRNDEALAAYRGYLALDPQWEEGWRTVGRLLLIKAEWQQALEAYDRAVELMPANAKAHLGRGEALAGLGRAPEAVAALRKALELDPASEREILAKLAPLYSRDLALDERLAAQVDLELPEAATVEDALAALMGATAVPMFAGEALAAKPVTMQAAPQPATEAMQALAASAGGRWRYERNLYLLEPDPAVTSELDHLTPELEEALADLLADARERPEAALPLFRIALELSERGNHVLALQYAEKAFALDPQVMSSVTIAHYYERCGRLTDAAQFYRLAEAQRQGTAACPLADVLWKLGEFDEAIEAKRACIVRLRNQAAGHSNLAGLLYQIGRLDEAREEILIALQGARDREQRERRERLLELIDQRAADPEAVRKLLDSGRIAMQYGRPALAAENFTAAVNLRPDLTEAQEALAEARLAIEEALK
jgi:tetratricopeptide (TPR) repeat protein